MISMPNVSMVLRAVKSVPKVASSKKGPGERYSEKFVPKKEYMVLPSIHEWQIKFSLFWTLCRLSSAFLGGGVPMNFFEW